MPWVAELLRITKRNGAVAAAVKFSNGDENFTQEVVSAELTPQSLAVFCRSVVESRDKVEASLEAFSNFQSGVISLAVTEEEVLTDPLSE